MDTQTPAETALAGISDRTAGMFGARSRHCASAHVVDAALRIEANDYSIKLAQSGT